MRNAKINRKADKAAATAELNAAEPRTPKDTGLQHRASDIDSVARNDGRYQAAAVPYRILGGFR